MSHAVSPSSGRRYGVALVCAEWGLMPSSYYAAKVRERRPAETLGRRGHRSPAQVRREWVALEDAA